MNDRRVVVTGSGALSCVGNSVKELWDSLINGRCGIDKVTRFDASEYRTQIAGEVKNFDVSRYVSVKEAKRLDLFCQYAIAACDEAMDEAGLPHDLANSPFDSTRVGVLVSSGIGGLATISEQAKVLFERGPNKVSPFLIPMMIGDLASGNISMRYGARGPNLGLVTACATGCHSIGEAFWMIKRDDADVMICGGVEASIVPLGFAGFCSLKAMSQRNDDPQHASRPFDLGRDGFVMSEGAGVLVIEELEHAKARGAKIYAEVAGVGMSADAHHLTASHPEGLGAKLVMRNALEDAEMKPEEVDYINVHGTSTPVGDISEVKAIQEVFGKHAYELNISSTKSMTGHLLGAAGAVEAIASILAIKNGIIPPTINHEEGDNDENIDYDLNFTFNKAQKREVNVALSNTFGFGGHNACVIFKKYAE